MSRENGGVPSSFDPSYPSVSTTEHSVTHSANVPNQEPTENYVILTPVPLEPPASTSHNHHQSTTTSYNILDESMKQLFQPDETPSNAGHPIEEDSGDDYDSRSTVDYGPEPESAARRDTKPDPFSPQCRIPLPGQWGEGGFGVDTRTFVRRRNERERARVRSVNDGFERLRSHLPLEFEPKDRRLSKVETLRYAIQYIQHLQSLLEESSDE